jgi:hypothetical protein
MIATACRRRNERPRPAASIFREAPASNQTAAWSRPAVGRRSRNPVSAMKLS